MKIALAVAPAWVADIIRASKKRPKTITLNVAALGAKRGFSCFAGDGERQYTYIRQNNHTEMRQSSWGGANMFAHGREKETNENLQVEFTPGTQVLETLYPKHWGWYLTVASDDPLVKMIVPEEE